jgi:hypothetical protein
MAGEREGRHHLVVDERVRTHPRTVPGELDGTAPHGGPGRCARLIHLSGGVAQLADQHAEDHRRGEHLQIVHHAVLRVVADGEAQQPHPHGDDAERHPAGGAAPRDRGRCRGKQHGRQQPVQLPGRRTGGGQRDREPQHGEQGEVGDDEHRVHPAQQPLVRPDREHPHDDGEAEHGHEGGSVPARKREGVRLDDDRRGAAEGAQPDQAGERGEHAQHALLRDRRRGGGDLRGSGGDLRGSGGERLGAEQGRLGAGQIGTGQRRLGGGSARRSRRCRVRQRQRHESDGTGRNPSSCPR